MDCLEEELGAGWRRECLISRESEYFDSNLLDLRHRSQLNPVEDTYPIRGDCQLLGVGMDEGEEEEEEETCHEED